MSDLQFLTILGIGFLLGARHALDADHIAAVATIVSERRSFLASGVVGFFWGLGHTLILLIVGLVIVAFKVTVSARVAAGFEYLVGFMLIVLGGSLALTIAKERWHLHAHDHGGRPHLHLHHHRTDDHHGHPHWLQGSLKPFAVGMVHGLAGSAALVLMAVSAVGTIGEMLLYFVVFGFGSILGMVLLGTAISVPLMFSTTLGRRATQVLQVIASLASISLGLLILSGYSPI